jgi:DNA-binding beta-propeller fold protein YncE
MRDSLQESDNPTATPERVAVDPIKKASHCLVHSWSCTVTIGGLGGGGVAINQRGEVVVAEWRGDRVSVFSSSGEKLRSFSTHGSGPGQMVSPRQVAVDGERNILVAYSGNHRIQRFTTVGIWAVDTPAVFWSHWHCIYVGETSN